MKEMTPEGKAAVKDERRRIKLLIDGLDLQADRRAKEIANLLFGYIEGPAYIESVAHNISRYLVSANEEVKKELLSKVFPQTTKEADGTFGGRKKWVSL